MPFFSVIIPTYNRHELAGRAVNSVLAQTFSDYELILVDDGSTDSTPLLADTFRGRMIYLRQDNCGVSAARNRGIRLSRAKWCAFLDSDDLWHPDKLKEQSSYIAAHPDIKISQCEEQWIRKGKRVNPGLRHIKPEGSIYLNSLELCLISPSSVVVSRELFDRYGMFDESLPACEDYDLWLKITAREKVGLLKKELNVRHGGHDDQLSQQYWGMDRFRIYSLVNMLISGLIESGEYLTRTRDIALQKSRILLSGAKKRGKEEFALEVQRVIDLLESGQYNSIDSRRLLQEAGPA
ncbi:MAG TPA: glycosyltransferase [Spirochaetota bacterium]|nr:glycosyltransferase [Spirochaetota bacterium]HPI88611.1 glycosyltransferase [Spirochaetota bacterium]HPR48252.1 glycosyltransferase [Spirochaetota bacterium]